MNLDMFDVKDRVVVITGGLGQLGLQFSKTLLERGARIAVLDVLDEDAASEKLSLTGSGEDNFIYIECDITSRESAQSALAIIEEKWESPHGLINNAALDSPPNASADENGPFEDYPEDSWDNVMNVNAKGVFIACQVYGGAMALKQRGSIVNVSSIYGVVSPNQDIYEYRRHSGQNFYKPVAYSASKSALLNLTRYLATYWGKNNIRVNTLVLGGVFNHQDDEFLNNYCKLVPLKRMANEDEYNGSIVFLMSDASNYMTGASVVLDGGWTAW